MMRCGHCDAAITAEEKTKRYKNGTSQTYIYYRCTKRKDKNCPEKYVEAADLSAQVDFLLSKLTISEKFQQWAIKYLHEIRKNEAHTKLDAMDSKKKEHQQITNQLASLLLKYAAPENKDGAYISDTEYQSLKTSLVTRKNTLETELTSQNHQGIEQWVELSERTFNFARYARIWFKQGDTETKRAVFSALGSNLVIKDKKLAVNLHPVFQTLVEKLENVEAELEVVRTSNNGLNEGQYPSVWVYCPALRRRRDSNSR
jgi:site-specific DNA recombinase